MPFTHQLSDLNIIQVAKTPTIFALVHSPARFRLIDPLTLNHVRPQHQGGLFGVCDPVFRLGARGSQGTVLVEVLARGLAGCVQDAGIAWRGMKQVSAGKNLEAFGEVVVI